MNSEATAYLKKHTESFLDKFPNSTDIWPIENVWAIIKQDLPQVSFTTIPEMKKQIIKAWQKIDADKELCHNLIASIPRQSLKRKVLKSPRKTIINPICVLYYYHHCNHNCIKNIKITVMGWFFQHPLDELIMVMMGDTIFGGVVTKELKVKNLQQFWFVCA